MGCHPDPAIPRRLRQRRNCQLAELLRTKLIDHWPIPYFGASVYDDPKIYARSSPIEFIRQVATPTFVTAGERDKGCPAPQAYEFWHALKTLGVKTKLVIYAGEGHRLHKPANIEDLARRIVAWFNEHLK